MLNSAKDEIYPAHKMPTIVGILTFIRINGWLWWFKPQNFINFDFYDTYEHFEFHAQLSWAWKTFYPGLTVDLSQLEAEPNWFVMQWLKFIKQLL